MGVNLRRRRPALLVVLCLGVVVSFVVHLQKNYTLSDLLPEAFQEETGYEDPLPLQEDYEEEYEEEESLPQILDSSWHPIDDLIKRANENYQKTITKRVFNVNEAATAYRSRRGRHPPPNFDRWFAFAQESEAVIIEDLFDQIYHDLEIFWAVSPRSLRTAPLDWPHVLTIRNHTAEVRAGAQDSTSTTTTYLEMFQMLEEYLPDLNIAINIDDMPHVIVPWDDVNELVNGAATRKHTRRPSRSHPIYSDYRNLAPIPARLPSATSLPTKSEKPYWYYAREACPPNSEARTTDLVDDMTADFEIPTSWPADSFQGYVSNWTLSKSACVHPHLANLHGSLLDPTDNTVATEPFPLFSSCKIQGINNDILLPPAYYWSEKLNFNAGEGEATAWDTKKTAFSWRGSATGGRHDANNWKHFHRHRFVAMQNASIVAAEENFLALQDSLPTLTSATKEPPHIFPFPDPAAYPLGALNTNPTSLAAWISPLTNVSFSNFLCAPWDLAPFGNPTACAYLEPHYLVEPYTSPTAQFQSKYIPDIDGHSWSARYRGYLYSGSLPIKTTIFAEWLDGRVWAWRHFVPMDNTFVDWWGIVEWLVGWPGGDNTQKGNTAGRKPGHDTAAQKIAEEGQAWAKRVLRREDMLVYLYRLVLEYARLCDERRESMGFVGDLGGVGGGGGGGG